MEGHTFAHADKHALTLSTLADTAAQVIIFSPHGLDAKEGERAIDWTCCVGENAHGREFADMPAVVQNDMAECGARLAEAINSNPTEIEGGILPCRPLHCLMSTCNPNVHNNRPIHGQFFAVIRDFVEKNPGKQRESAISASSISKNTLAPFRRDLMNRFERLSSSSSIGNTQAI